MKGLYLKKLLVIIISVFLALSALAIFGIGAAGCVPVINSLSAYQGSPGNVITINGSFFGSTPQANRVFMGDKLEMHVITASANKLTAMVPYDDSGTYHLRVETSAGASVPKNFTIDAQAFTNNGTDLQAASADLTGIFYTLYDTAGAFAMLQTPYSEEARASCWSSIHEMNDSPVVPGISQEIINLWVDSGVTDVVYHLWLLRGGGPYVKADVDMAAGTVEAWLDNFSALIAKEGSDHGLEEALSQASADIERARMFLPSAGDNIAPKVWVDGIPDRFNAGQTYTVTAYGLDDVARDCANSGVDYLYVTAVYVDNGGPADRIASEYLNVDWFWNGEEPVGRGYAHPLQLQFTVPSNADSSDLIRLIVIGNDCFSREGKATYERKINTTVKAPHLSNAYITPTHMADLNALGNAQVYLEWSDADYNISSLKYEFFGEGIKNRGTFTKTASSLGISGSSGSMTKRVSDLVTVDNVFSSGKCYWAGMRMWLVDSQGNISDNGVVTFFMDGEGNEQVFNITVSDSESDGKADDRFAFVTDTWFTYHLTPVGGKKSAAVRVGDMPPGATNVTLRVWCVYSEGSTGSCRVLVSDGATFYGGGTTKTFNVTYDSQNPEEKVFQIIPPPEQDPPPPGS